MLQPKIIVSHQNEVDSDTFNRKTKITPEQAHLTDGQGVVIAEKSSSLAKNEKDGCNLRKLQIFPADAPAMPALCNCHQVVSSRLLLKLTFEYAGAIKVVKLRCN